MTSYSSSVSHSAQRFFQPKLVSMGQSWPTWPLVDLGWPLRAFWPKQCIALLSGILPMKFGSHRPFLSNLMSAWTRLTPVRPWSRQCATVWSGVQAEFSSCRAFLRHIDMWMTFDLWPLIGLLCKVALKPWGPPLTPYQVLAQCVEALRNA